MCEKGTKNATFSDALFHSRTSGHIVNLLSLVASRTGFTIFRRTTRRHHPF